MEKISPSCLSTFRSCPRKYEFTYVRGRVPVAAAPALNIGLLWHKAMEVYWTAGREAAIQMLIGCAGEVDEVDVAKLVALLKHYNPPVDRYTVEGVEVEFTKQIPIPGRRAMRGVRLFGRVDLVVRDGSGNLLVVEHKTSGADSIMGFGSYWQRLNLDTQTSLYMVGIGVGCVLYDVVKKPGLRPSKADEALAKAHGCSVIDAYIERLSNEIAANPEEYFQFREIVKTPEDLEEALSDVRGWISALRQYRSAGFYPRNTDSCRGLFGFCPYLEVCSGSASLDDETLFRDK